MFPRTAAIKKLAEINSINSIHLESIVLMSESKNKKDENDYK